MTITEELPTKQENVEKSNSCNEELNQLLVEAKTTIIDLQRDLTAFKEKVETLQQQNDLYAHELAELKSNKGAKMSERGEMAPSITQIPLEPTVIVDTKVQTKRTASAKRNRNRQQSKTIASSGHRSQVDTNSSNEDDSSEDVDTYVVYERNRREKEF